jgi:DnaJ-class molecular chaperone
LKNYKDVCCHICRGTGEVIEEPGGDGYPPLYMECPECKGEGYLVLDKRLVYQE